MMILVMIMLGVFVLTLAFPLLDVYVSNKAAKEVTEYVFPMSLIDAEHGDGNKGGTQVNRISMQYRGSIRMAGGRVISKEQLEEKKKEVYSVLLP